LGDPDRTLVTLASQLRDEDSVVSPHVVDPTAGAVLGRLAAAGPRAAAAPGEYAAIVESVREGYLLHYGEPRIVLGADEDLRLLAGDYLYALGLDRLAGLGDLDAVRELSDLISLAARVHDGGRSQERRDSEACWLWLASVVAIGTGATDEHRAAKAALRAGDPAAADRLQQAAGSAAAAAGLGGPLTLAADAIDCSPRAPS
jgi:hypothetical protein